MRDTLQLQNGNRTVEVELPPSWSLEATLQSLPHNAIDIAKALDGALAHPIGASPFSEWVSKDGKICIVVDDASRPTPVKEIFPVLLKKLLQQGICREQMTVLVATGTHAPMSRTAIAERLGAATDGIEVLNHDGRDEEALADLGVTSSGMPLKVNRRVVEADLVLSIGTIEPHIMAGFGGGYKNIVPGCAGEAAVAATHLLGPAAERFGNVGRIGEDCAVRRRLEEAASKAAPRCFVVNTVLDSANRTVGLFCGDPVKAHRAGCALARDVWGAPLEAKADVLLANSYPMTYDLCQASKAFSTGIAAVREGGLVMLFLQCREGLGDYCVRPTAMSYERTREIVRTQGTESYTALKQKEAGETLPFYETFLTQSNAEALRKADIFVYTPDIPFETMDRFGLFKAFRSFEAMMAEAAGLHPSARVVYSPCGGTCYPYFT